MIKVILHTLLQRKTETGTVSQLELNLPEGSTVESIIKSLDVILPIDSLILVVNHHNVEQSYQLTDGDTVDLIPAMSGG